MRFKLVPEPPESLDFVATAQKAVPLVPGSEDDCCARMLDRTDLTSRDEARTWLTFLRALGLAEETDSGFARVRADPEPASLRERFREGVFGVPALLEILDESDGPVSVDEAFGAFRDEVPTWEHHKNPNSWETIWRERVEYLLDWATLLGLAEKTEDGYRAA
ncbi:hypothetical protein NGM10_12670 [Halorussus salilacus]|uniref:hypothetical protein n=1 Tax=Halorussus salilacus TaxID=2953750 RepID=UPI00209D382A|nr:hypothetical protein [Halorussus salilacus]USZ67577.1 hypothetical protein NGM10_12670 [Halorussus salilacus]